MTQPALLGEDDDRRERHLSPADASRILKRCRRDPLWFMQEVLGQAPFAHQVQIAESVRDHQITRVKSAHSIGKDWIAARIVEWFLSCNRPSKVITTAPTDRQVRLILWSEIRTAHSNARVPLGGHLLTQELQHGPDHFATGFSARDYDPNAFAGFHSESILVVLDEADGISDAIREAVLSLLSGGHARLLEIGNPLTPQGAFAKGFASEIGNNITISAFDSPNFTFFGITPQDIESGEWAKKIDRDLPAPFMITPQWVHDRWVEAGRNWEDPFIRSRIRALFPLEDADAVFSLGTIENACEASFDPDSPIVLACDVARFGDDETVFGLRRGRQYRRVDHFQGQDTMQTTNRLIALAREYGAQELRVDDDGVGGGVIDSLHEKLPETELGCRVVPMRGGSAAKDADRYANSRAEWHWELRQRLIDNEVDLDRADHALQAQLAQIRRGKYDKRGRIVIEEKAELKKRLGRSPDDADTCIYAFATPNADPPFMFEAL